MLASGPGFAQSRAPQKKPPAPQPPAGQKWPIESITVEGDRFYSRDLILAVAGLKVGQVAGQAEFDRARDRLVATGRFATVSYKFEPAASAKGYTATFQVTEIEQVYPVVFEDLGVSSKELVSALEAKDPLFSPDKLAATQPVLERFNKWIQEYLASKGKDEKISAAVRPSPVGGFAVVFRPARSLPMVAQVTFEGNKVVTQSVLREAIAGVAIGSPYTEDAFRLVLNAAIRPVYEARGRVRVAFPQIRTEPAKDVEGIHVIVTVDEGQSYELGKVTIEGPTPLAPEALLKAGDFKGGDVANIDRVSEGLERIRLVLRHAGYLEAKVTSERTNDDTKKIVDVAVHVEAGPQFMMGKLNLVGLDLEGEVEMRRIWTLKEGKPFNPDYPDLFLKRVKDEGMFDNLGPTKSDLKLNPRDHTADVTLTFKGAEPGQGRPGRRGRGRGY